MLFLFGSNQPKDIKISFNQNMNYLCGIDFYNLERNHCRGGNLDHCF